MSDLTKLEKLIGKDTVLELEKMSGEDLKQRIIQANQAIKQVADELQANEKYQQIKRDKSYLEQGKKDVNKRQNAIIKHCLHLMEEKGISALSEENQLKELVNAGKVLLSNGVSESVR